MLNIIGKKNWYFLISLLIIIPGIVSLLLYGLKPSIEFTGGSRQIYLFEKSVSDKQVQEIEKVFEEKKVEISTLQRSDRRVILRTTPIDERKNQDILSTLDKRGVKFRQENFETIGPTIGREITLNAIKAIALASVLIVLYIAWSFRKVPKPASSWRFGITAIITLIHDVLVLLGIFSLFGHFFGVEVDSLFLTALLTSMGFSVHDTIVVFDRIRENLMRTGGQSFGQIVNDSILQTMSRSLNTSLTAILVLVTLLIFGGETIKWFVIALLIGLITGTYSSIFNAAPLLVAWQELDQRRKNKKSKVKK
jgi:preprotein translocase subunit SecF